MTTAATGRAEAILLGALGVAGALGLWAVTDGGKGVLAAGEKAAKLASAAAVPADTDGPAQFAQTNDSLHTASPQEVVATSMYVCVVVLSFAYLSIWPAGSG